MFSHPSREGGLQLWQRALAQLTDRKCCVRIAMMSNPSLDLAAVYISCGSLERHRKELRRNIAVID